MKKRVVLSLLSIVISTSSLLFTACGNKDVSAMSNNVPSEIEISSSSIEESSIAEESSSIEESSTTEVETESEIESSTEIESLSAEGEEKETSESTEIDESKLANAVGEVDIEEYNAGNAESTKFTTTPLDTMMYATQQCNIRQAPSIEDAVIGSLLQTQEIHVTGKVNEANWYEVSLQDGSVGYISSKLLTETKPTVQIETPAPTTQQEAASQSEELLTPDQVINPVTGEPIKPGDTLPSGATHLGHDWYNPDEWH